MLSCMKFWNYTAAKLLVALTLENISDEGKHSGDEDYKGGAAQEDKGVDTLENNKNFYCKQLLIHQSYNPCRTN